MRTLSIRLKMIAAVMLFLLLSGGLLLHYVYRHTMQLTGEASLATAARLFDDLERADVDRLGSTIDAIQRIEALRDAFLARDRDRLHAAAAPLFEELKARHHVTHWYFHDLDGTCFLRVHSRKLFGDRIERATLLQSMATKTLAAGKELGKTAFALRVVEPYVAGGRIVGYIELGEEIDAYLRTMQAMTRDEYALVIEKRHLDEREWAATRPPGARNGWGDDAALLVVDETSAAVAPPLGWAASALPADGQVLEPIDAGQRRFLRGIYPVGDAMGRPVGGLVVFHDTTAVQRSLLSGRIGALLGALVALVLLLAGLVALMNRLVFSRLRRAMRKLEEVSVRLAGGDHDVGAEIRPVADDEIGQFEAFFAKFLVMVGAALREAEARPHPPSAGTGTDG